MNNQSPLVSVIIPCYNVADWVEKAIRSVLHQTYQNLEVWVIDDASADETLEKIKGFTDPRINLLACDENTKKVGAVNEVLKKVRGEYICFQDADDWSEPGRVAEQLKAFARDPQLGICFTNYGYIGGAKKNKPGKIAMSNEELRKEFLDFYKDRNFFESPTNCPTMMISRAALEKTGGYSPYFAGRVAEDIQWIYRIIKEFKAITLPQVLYHYNLRPGSFTAQQVAGLSARYAYSWELLSRIIHKDVNENKDLLAPGNEEYLKAVELEACEAALLEAIKERNSLQRAYEESTSFRVGKIILAPLRILRSFKKK